VVRDFGVYVSGELPLVGRGEVSGTVRFDPSGNPI
jgi:hypothetical protein